MVDEDSYKAGQEVIYVEDGNFLRIKILKNSSDKHRVSYRMRIIKVITHGPLAGIMHAKLEEGEKFNFFKQRNMGGFCGGLGKIVGLA